MTPIFSNNIKILKSSVQNVTDIFPTQKIFIVKTRKKLQLIKEIQIYRQMTMYG